MYLWKIIRLSFIWCLKPNVLKVEAKYSWCYSLFSVVIFCSYMDTWAHVFMFNYMSILLSFCAWVSLYVTLFHVPTLRTLLKGTCSIHANWSNRVVRRKDWVKEIQWPYWHFLQYFFSAILFPFKQCYLRFLYHNIISNSKVKYRRFIKKNVYKHLC